MNVWKNPSNIFLYHFFDTIMKVRIKMNKFLFLILLSLSALQNVTFCKDIRFEDRPTSLTLAVLEASKQSADLFHELEGIGIDSCYRIYLDESCKYPIIIKFTTLDSSRVCICLDNDNEVKKRYPVLFSNIEIAIRLMPTDADSLGVIDKYNELSGLGYEYSVQKNRKGFFDLHSENYSLIGPLSNDELKFLIFHPDSKIFGPAYNLLVSRASLNRDLLNSLNQEEINRAFFISLLKSDKDFFRNILDELLDRKVSKMEVKSLFDAIQSESHDSVYKELDNIFDEIFKEEGIERR